MPRSFLRRLAGLAVLVALCLPASPTAHAQQVAPPSDALQGLEGLYLLGGDVPPEAESASLSKRAILTDVERRLRDAGVPVLSEEEWLMQESAPVLNVDVQAVRGEGDVYAYGIRLEVLHLVTPVSNPQKTTYAVIWGNGVVGAVAPDDLRRLRNAVTDLTDRLISDYLAANP